MSLIAAVGARIATGLHALGAATSIRARKSFVRETRFVDRAGEAIGLATVASISEDVVGRDRFVALGTPALREACDGVTTPVPLYLAGPTETDPLDTRGTRLLAALAQNAPIDAAKSRVFPHGRAAGAIAIEQALGRISRGEDEAILVGGIDSYVDPDRLEALDVAMRLHGPQTENGFVPGEGAAFLLLASRRRATAKLANIVGVGLEKEPRPYGSPEPTHALGITLACKRALASTPGSARIGWALTDVVGERHRVEEWLYAAGRIQQQCTPDLRVDTPLLLTGDLGAASVPLLCVLACMGWKIGTGAGPLALVAGHSDGADRGAVLLRTEDAG
jgi:3-oxoacyl-[acyl-carrier-protein] synthase-1